MKIKKIFFAPLALLLLLSFFACAPQVYGHAELQIPLSDDYKSRDVEDFDAAYVNGESTVGIVRLSLDAAFNSGIPETLLAEDFAEFYMKKTGRNEEIKYRGNVPYYQFYTQAEGESIFELLAFFRSKHAYFIIFFVTADEGCEARREEFLSACEGVVFIK